MTNLIIAALFRGSTPLPFAQTHSEQPCGGDILSAALEAQHSGSFGLFLTDSIEEEQPFKTQAHYVQPQPREHAHNKHCAINETVPSLIQASITRRT